MDKFMKMALKLAGMVDPFPNPRVGAVLVKDGKVLGTGYHRKAGMPHAEIEAIRDAEGKGRSVRGATLYVTLEPCSHRLKRTPPCTDAIMENGISKVVYGMKDPNPLVSGEIVLKKAGIKVEGPLAQKEVGKLISRYANNIAKKPIVVIKMAMSADGKTATRTGDSKWISGGAERMLIRKMRSEVDVVMVGAGTVLRDDPRLTSRLSNAREPMRVIIDGRLRIPLDACVLRNEDGKTIVATSEMAPRGKIEKIAGSTFAHIFVCGKKEVDLNTLVDALGGMGAKKIMIEGGSELNASALEAGIVDKLIVIISPKIIGGRDAKPVIGGLGIEKMSQAVLLKNRKIRKVGDDLLLEFDISR